MAERKPRILLGVTADMSLRLMRGFPEYLVAHGWDVHVVSSPGPALAALGTTAGVTVHAVPMARQPSPLHDLRALLAWVGLLRRVRPDVSSVGTPKAALLGSVAGWLTRVPARVYLLRGLRLETTTGATRRLLMALEKVTVACSHSVLSVSDSLRTLVIGLGLVKPSKVVVLGAGSSNGVDLERFDRRRTTDAQRSRLRAEIGIAPDPPVVGFVGRLTEDKGLGVLARSRALLEAHGVDYQLLLVGGVDDSTAGSEVRRLRDSGRPPVEVGQREDSERFFQIIDVLCLPTLREGFPNVVIEAAAAGVPTVTTDATGAVDAVVDAETGLIAHAGSADALAGCLTALISDDEVRGRFGHNARARAVGSYSNRDVWRRMEDYYLLRLRPGTGEVVTR